MSLCLIRSDYLAPKFSGDYFICILHVFGTVAESTNFSPSDPVVSKPSALSPWTGSIWIGMQMGSIWEGETVPAGVVILNGSQRILGVKSGDQDQKNKLKLHLSHSLTHYDHETFNGS